MTRPMKLGWHYIAGRWFSVTRTPDPWQPWGERRRQLLDMLESAEDVELYCAELGLSREQAHG